MHTTEFVERPKIAPIPPVQKITASAAIRFHFHGPQVHGANPAAYSALVDHRRQKRLPLAFLDLAFGFVPPHLLIQRVQ